jgi:hypothetical protein
MGFIERRKTNKIQTDLVEEKTEKEKEKKERKERERII